MKLSFSAFVAAVLIQPTLGDYDCSICEGLYTNDPTIPTVLSLLNAQSTANIPQSSRGSLIQGIAKDFLVDGKTLPGVDRLPNIECWNVRGISSFRYIFHNYQNTDAYNVPSDMDLNCWDTQDVTDMSRLFLQQHEFNGSLNGWNTKKVTTMEHMFYDNHKFNQKLDSFDTSQVQDMTAMFKKTHVFDQPLSHFDTSSVTTMKQVFNQAKAFNQDISSWDVRKSSSFNSMFYEAVKFNQPLDDWDPSQVNQDGYMFGTMFQRATAFNQCLGSWADKVFNTPDEDAKEWDRLTYMFDQSGCPLYENLHGNKSRPLRDGTTNKWVNKWCNAECQAAPATLAPTDAPTDAPTALGRFEVAHREVSDQVGSLVKMEPLSVDVYFKVGSSIDDKTKLSLEVYGTLDIDATKACDAGQKIEAANGLTLREIGLVGTAGTAGFELDVTKLAANFKAYNGAKVDICARVKYDNTIQTFVDTRVVIDRTYTADLTGNAVTIADPSSGKFNKADQTTVSVTEFFCNADKSQLGSTGLTFGPGQDIRICVDPIQDTDDNNLFMYKVSDFSEIKCTFEGDSVELPINLDGTFNKKEPTNDYGCGSFVFVLLNSDVAKSASKQLQCTGKVTLASERKPTTTTRRLSSGSSNDNDRSLQETPEDVETEFSIDLTITDEDSGASSVSITAFALAGGSLAAALL